MENGDLSSLGRSEVDNIVDRVFVTLPISQYEVKERRFTSHVVN